MNKFSWYQFIIAMTAVAGVVFAGFQSYMTRKEFELKNRAMLKFEITKLEDLNEYFRYFPSEDQKSIILQISGKFTNWGSIPGTNIKLEPFTLTYSNGQKLPVEVEQKFDMIVYPGDVQPLKLNLVFPTSDIVGMMKVFESALRGNEFTLKFNYNSLGDTRKPYWIECSARITKDAGAVLSITGN